MKPWQKRRFRENTNFYIRWLIDKGYAKTEEEAYTLFKYMCKHSTREFLPDGRISCYRYGFPTYPSDNSS